MRDRGAIRSGGLELEDGVIPGEGLELIVGRCRRGE
jgi:hypothetical protein